ncbi:hypothetical protein [Nocardioides sp.]|uniref:hypothetical protein n=1 Tax=Nocardioides sp. TaxID=35761 RepID=UPI003D13070F
MDTDRRAYDDLATPLDMVADCHSIEVKLRFDRIAKAASQPAPSLRYEDHPVDVAKRDISVSEATARLAAALYQD